MSDKFFFPNLNGVRFIAALLVIVHHVEQMKYMFHLESSLWQKSPFIEVIGKLGVVLFFVLSGFLITYLLLKEKDVMGKVDVKSFYIRRMLRIWPLYYVILILGFAIIPFIPFFNIPVWTDSVFSDLNLKIFLFILFLPNVARVLFEPVPYVSQTWSIGVEEQFYLVWPFVINLAKNIFKILTVIIVLYMVVKFSLIYLSKSETSFLPVVRFWNNFNINCMAIGGFAASFFYFKKQTILHLIYSAYTQVFLYLALILLLYFGVEIPLLHFEIYGIIFAMLILNLATNPKSLVSLDNIFFEYLGKISYGLYMYHYFAIVIVLRISELYFTINSFSILILSTLLTIALSSLSYHFIEKSFLKLKNRFAHIQSGKQ